ncbi:TonB-dependent receptor [Pseudoduganella ginsengisoli]|uniref:TonB-dependent receptor n=1 Tax=Pseudoduganella ginsengisoli TaxID=1462440 RepID=A0A6L6Q730_9BURK|nr:TonB-dependent receptor [Pseudoduganella ginsengisoli]MTW04932.1 TonB-dependent receptor [Pseudoduganella ginsengisoli]
MMKETVLSRSVRLMFSGSLVAAGLLSAPAMAQQGDQQIQRVEITGSAIKRIAAEGALPVQSLSKAQIEQTGATTVADLVATLPSMQGFVTSSASVNGSGGGVQTASVHAIGTSYTLVLLNGRRIAPYSSGSAVNLASIPLSAVERVEILTDGASALYGSDAIAGVVNFILKKNSQDANIELTYNRPSKGSAGATSNVAISKGFGDYEANGFNVMLSYSHDTQSELNASDRPFSAPGGVHPYSEGGKNYSLYMLSSNSIPGNVAVKDGSKTLASFNPGLINSGSCGAPNTFKVGNRCLFNYGATVELLPELKRDGFFVNANVKINDNLKFFAEGLYSKFTSTARYAPPAQPLSLDINSALFKANVVPALVKLGVDPAKVKTATMNLRLVDAGGRTDGWETNAKHLALGLEGTHFGWDWTTAYVHSENKAIDNAVAGYTSGDKLDALMKAGTYNPFIVPTAETKAALASAVLHQELDVTTSKIDVLNLRGSREIFQAGGGAAMLALGADMSTQKYIDEPAPIAMGPNSLQPNWTDTNVGGGTGSLPVDSSRKNWGAFAELVVPVMKGLEVTGDLRYDSYDAVKNKKNFDSAGNLIAPATQGDSASKATYKLSAAWRPVDNLLVRASYGTGFKAPILTDVTKPVVNGGSSGFHPCPITSGPLLKLCNGNAEYGLLDGGNALSGAGGLKPETSKQATIGFRVEPVKNVSIGFDLWDVKINDQIRKLPENEVFNNPAKYMGLFSSYYDPIQKENVLVASLTPFNLASSHYQGIDWDHTFGLNTGMGKFTFNWTGTYMLKANQQALATDPVEGSVGRFDSYNDVVFRLITKGTVTWKQSDALTHSLTAVYKSGYHDMPLTEDDGAIVALNSDGSIGDYVGLKRDVKSYTVWDWQTRWKFNKNFTITGGIKNLFNTEPPFSQRIAGGGNQLGYDGRYTDPLGRQFYLVGSYKF